MLNSSNVFNDGANVGIGTSTPSAKLHVAGTTRLADGTEGAAKLLTSDASGNASWQNLNAASIFGSGNVPNGDLSCASNLAFIGTGTAPYSVAVAGNHAYVVNYGSNTLQVFNVSNPALPNLSATIATGTNPRSVAVVGNFAYVVNNGSHNLQVFNVSNPAAPSLSATIGTGSNPISVAVAGNYAYVVNQSSNTLQVFNVSSPAAPSLSATVFTGSQPYSVAVAGNYAYVVNQSSNTLQVFNVSSPAAPSLSATIATANLPWSVAVAGNYAYVVNYNSNNLQVFNVSNAAAPSLSATIATFSGPSSVAVAGNYAYVMNYSSNTMQVFNVNNPAAPSLAANFSTTAGPVSVAAAGNNAYMVNQTSSNLQVLKVFCPNIITMNPGTGTFTTQPMTGAVGPQGVQGPQGPMGPTGATGPQGVSITNAAITSDSLYVTLSNASVINAGRATGAQGPIGPQGPVGPAVNANGTLNHLAKFDTSGTILSDAFLFEDTLGNVGIGNTAPTAKLHVTGTTRLADGTQGAGKLLTSDANGNASWQNLNAASLLGNGTQPTADPSCMGTIATIATGGFSTSVAVSGSYAYVTNASGGNNLKIFNVANPASPALVATIGTGTTPEFVAVSGTHAYVANYSSNTMMVFNVTNPAAPVLVATIATGSNPKSVAIGGNHAYVVNDGSNNMSIFNVTNPAAPSLVATIATGSRPYHVAVSGNFAYVVNYDSHTMSIYNVTNPAAPALVSTIASAASPRSVGVNGNHAFVVVSGNIKVFNVTDPAAPALVATYAMGVGTFPTSVAVSGNYACVTDFNLNNMRVLNVTNPAAPALVSTMATGGPSVRLTIQGNYAYAVSTAGVLSVHQLFCTNAVMIDPLTGLMTTTQPYWSLQGNGSLATTTTGNVGIGTTSPQAQLDVRNSGGSEIRASLSNTHYGQFQFGSGGLNITSINQGNEFRPISMSGKETVFNTGIGTLAEQMRITSAGNVGIGDAAPGFKLSVRTPSNTANARVASLANAIGDPALHLVTSRGSTSNASGALTTQIGQAYDVGAISEGLQFFRGNSATDGSLALITNNTERLRITSTGNVGIGTNAPTAMLSVNGSANNLSGSWGTFSDARIKTVRREFTDGLSVIDRLRPVVFTYNAEAPFPSEKEQVGVIAQELELLAPYMVSQQERGELCDLREVDNQAYVFLLINAVKELNTLVQEQQRTINELRAGNTEKDAALDAIRTQLDANTALMLKLQSVLEAQTRK